MLRPRNLMQPAARYPADPRAVFILALSVFSGFVALLAQAAPGTLEEQLPRWGVVVWGITLTGGSFLALAGLARDTDNGIIVEQIGSMMTGVAALFYSGVALIVIGVSAFQIVGIVIAWGLACILRWWQLQLLLRKRANDRLHARVQDGLRQALEEE